MGGWCGRGVGDGELGLGVGVRLVLGGRFQCGGTDIRLYCRYTRPPHPEKHPHPAPYHPRVAVHPLSLFKYPILPVK